MPEAGLSHPEYNPPTLSSCSLQEDGTYVRGTRRHSGGDFPRASGVSSLLNERDAQTLGPNHVGRYL